MKNFFETISGRWAVITGIISEAYIAINFVTSYSYKLDCQQHYNIPAKYFSSSIDSKLFYLLIMIALAVSLFLPAILRHRQSQLKVVDNVCYTLLAILIGLGISCVNLALLSNSLPIICQFFKIQLNGNLIVVLGGIVIIAPIVVSLGSAFLRYLFNAQAKTSNNLVSSSHTENQRESSDRTSKNILSNFKLFIKRIGKFTFIGSLIICVLLFGLSIIQIFTLSISSKTAYETLTIKESNEKMAVLSDIDSYHVLVAPLNYSKNNEVLIDTTKYKIIDKTGLTLSLTNFDLPPKIAHIES